MEFKIDIPDAPAKALELLRDSGYDAYIVGGCVRDSLRGEKPSDYDITASAQPMETEAVFSGYRVIETGLKHGTVSVIIDGETLEITTFRVDGEYENNRRPKQVEFTRSLADDLSRRDFTVNAMAYSPETGLVDLFGGREDLSRGIIRAVGEPEKRFEEDALRILRAMRFASVFDFTIEEKTAKAMQNCRKLLKNISAERCFVELSKLLLGGGAERILCEYREILAVIIPELRPTFDFDQRNPHHIYDVYTHTVKAVSFCPADRNIRLAALFHDIGKPSVFSLDENGVGHFYGHSAKSVEIAKAALERLKVDNATKRDVLELIRRHDPVIEETEAAVGKCLRRMGTGMFEALLSLKAADNLAQAPQCKTRLDGYDRLRDIARRLMERYACLSLRSLAINGDDLINILGYTPDRTLGKTLSILLDAVISGDLPNEKDALLDYARGLKTR